MADEQDRAEWSPPHSPHVCRYLHLSPKEQVPRALNCEQVSAGHGRLLAGGASPELEALRDPLDGPGRCGQSESP